MPKISVLMSVLNGESFLLSALQSLQSQTVSNFEAIIVDDGSIDATSRIIEKLLLVDSRFRLISNPTNLGLPQSLNIAASYASGDFHFVMGADDFLGPRFFESMLDEFDSEYCDFIYSDYYLIDENNKIQGIASVEDKHLLVCGMVMGVSRMWRRELFQAVGGFKAETFMFEDYEFSVNVYQSGARIKRVVRQDYFYRIHPNQLTNSRDLPDNYYSFRYVLVKDQLKSLNSEIRGRAIVAFLHTCLIRRRYVFALKLSILAVINWRSATVYVKKKLQSKYKNEKLNNL
jgi:glycosyltransferase involved in cell wall biosynthesis